jgi:DNA-binding NtrC family response regulator
MPRAEEPAENRKRVVLVVEDDILVRATLSESLREYGFRVIEAANAAEAVAVFSSGEPVDIVFTDWHMPGDMDGVALARWVAKHHSAIRVLLTSGRGDAASARASVPSDAFFGKPYRAEDVANRIHAVLGARDRSQGRG